MDAIIITGEELRALGFAGAPDGDYLAGEWLLEWIYVEEKSPGDDRGFDVSRGG